MSELETQQTTQEASGETTVPASQTAKKSSLKGVVAAIAVVVVIILGILYVLEKEGRSSTSLFADIIEKQQANAVVATVNGEDIINAKLDTSIKQFSQVAVAQGVDVADPEVQAGIRDQALEVLINTQLLKQEADSRGITVSDADVDARLAEIKEELGGEEVLSERMAALGIETDQLYTDIRDEIIIRQLLDQVFAEAVIEVTEEEITSVYEGAGGADAGLPALEEVYEEVEAQIVASKEQAAIDGFINELKSEAEIDLVEVE